MQQIKSIYVFAYTIYALALSVYASIQLFKQANGLWAGVLLTVIPGLAAALWRHFFAIESGTDERESVVTALALVGLAVVLVGDSERGWLLLLAFSGVVGLLLHTYWATAIGGAPPRLDAGDIDTLALSDISGAPRHLTEWRGQPCLVLVVRGRWCSYSAVQLRRLVAAMQQLDGRRTAVVCIGPQSPKVVPDRIRRAGITVLQLREGSPDLTAGLVLPGLGHNLWPSLVVLDAGGEVCYRESADNYRLPPQPENALSHLD